VPLRRCDASKDQDRSMYVITVLGVRWKYLLMSPDVVKISPPVQYVHVTKRSEKDKERNLIVADHTRHPIKIPFGVVGGFLAVSKYK